MTRPKQQAVSIPNLLTARQFAAIYQISVAAVYRMIKNKELPAEKIGQQWRIRGDAKKMLESSTATRTVYILQEQEVAALLERTPRMVRFLCQKGFLKYRWVGSVRRFSVGDVKEYLRVYATKRRHREAGPRASVIEWAKEQLQALDQQ